jgi:hypothetical protein
MLSRLHRLAGLLAPQISRRLGRRHGASRYKDRRYIPAELGVEGVACALRDKGVRYVVIRWFQDLPAIRPGGDLDLLVHDDDLAAADEIFDKRSGVARCDVYSVSGLPGSSYFGVPYLPPDKAAALLDRAVTFAGVYSVPHPADHFLSLAFHSVYHKGVRSGVPALRRDMGASSVPDNDYPGMLARLAGELAIDVGMDLDDLDSYLTERGWGPTPEMLPVLLRRNPWAAKRFGVQDEDPS